MEPDVPERQGEKRGPASDSSLSPERKLQRTQPPESPDETRIWDFNKKIGRFEGSLKRKGGDDETLVVDKKTALDILGKQSIDVEQVFKNFSDADMDTMYFERPRWRVRADDGFIVCREGKKIAENGDFLAEDAELYEDNVSDPAFLSVNDLEKVAKVLEKQVEDNDRSASPQSHDAAYTITCTLNELFAAERGSAVYERMRSFLKECDIAEEIESFTMKRFADSDEIRLYDALGKKINHPSLSTNDDVFADLSVRDTFNDVEDLQIRSESEKNHDEGRSDDWRYTFKPDEYGASLQVERKRNGDAESQKVESISLSEVLEFLKDMKNNALDEDLVGGFVKNTSQNREAGFIVCDFTQEQELAFITEAELRTLRPVADPTERDITISVAELCEFEEGRELHKHMNGLLRGDKNHTYGKIGCYIISRFEDADAIIACDASEIDLGYEALHTYDPALGRFAAQDIFDVVEDRRRARELGEGLNASGGGEGHSLAGIGASTYVPPPAPDPPRSLRRETRQVTRPSNDSAGKDAAAPRPASPGERGR